MRRRLLLGCLAATVVGAGLSAHGHEAPGAGRDREAADGAAPAFGTVIDFELTDAGGNRVRAVDLRGRWLLIFFGYTSCPDLCPTTLSEIAGALAQLGPLAARVQPVFVSIDPQRDTPGALREYVQNFDTRILPLSGNAEQLARAAGSIGVVFYKVPGPTPDEYTFAHNAIVTLVGPEGGIVTRFSSDAVVDDLARALHQTTAAPLVGCLTRQPFHRANLVGGMPTSPIQGRLASSVSGTDSLRDRCKSVVP